MYRLLSFVWCLAATCLCAVAQAKDLEGQSEAAQSAHAFTFEMPYGEPIALKDYAGKAILIVNTATECGFSGQLAGLQKLHETYSGRGLLVLGVPSNDFGGQEPRADGDIAKFCEAKYGAEFPLAAKTVVKGKKAHPFYRWAASELGPTARPYWNFHKYLVGPDGSILAWFPTPVPPTSSDVTAAIEKALPGS
ncbi:glutathione peroxidase [Labrenzia sp. ac12]